MTSKKTKLVPDEFLRIIAIWSVIPSYLLAGGLIGYGIDTWIGTFPYITGIGMILALVLAVKDMMRLRETVFKKKDEKEGQSGGS